MPERKKTAPWKRTEKDRRYTARVNRVRDRAWQHPYETRNDDICIHCGQIGSYIHTRPEDR